MNQIGTFLRAHWLTLVLLVGSLAGVSWVVRTQRAPGAMTVVEAQAMDMTVMKAPPGVHPVALEEVALRAIGDTQSFPATVEALDDEDVVARIPGRVSKLLVYPGDAVRAGQLLATLDADEIGAESGAMALDASAVAAAVEAAESEVAERRSMKAQSQAGVRAAEASIKRAEADHEATLVELQRAREDVRSAQAALAERKAELLYAEQDLARERKLHQAGAISLDELQAAQKERDAHGARVRSAEASLRSSEQGVRAAERRAQASEQSVAEMRAMRDSAFAGVRQTEDGISRAQAEARAKRLSAAAARAKSSAAGATAGYRQLRALSDGVVSERVVSVGTAVGMGQVVLRLKSIRRVRVQADVPQGLAAAAHPGMPVRIAADGNSVSGALTSVFPTVDPATRTFRVEALLDNPGWLKPGLYARLSLGTGPVAEQPSVRKEAVRRDSEGATFVWVVAEREGTPDDSDWTCTMHPEISEDGPGICPKCKMDLTPRSRGGGLEARRRSVRIGGTDGTHTAILEGLDPGERVIWAGHENLIEGSPVEAVEWGPNGPTSIPKPNDSQAPGGHEGHAAAPDSDPHAGHDHAAMGDYLCPMDPEVHSHEPGSCPICKMDLVKEGTQ